ncbi:hypothetical protein K388_03458 [Streptomyces sp. KhCrAH-43]|uniref:hypothetical protein n=1 Tax=Streptomyces TaxID=1883 RepID=UPI000365FE0D|nr:hypothetical protein [Streptomyces sp. KhCrAH-43]MYS34116.1 hypothetical protein [Streptomyces sp. SID4920]MYX70105.1 hypothetical protein [Streptomyces sp. SID8373]RAJ61084.1 hypothetical protein K388_03458 [Streptomyces sp. KhCrAH-43]
MSGDGKGDLHVDPASVQKITSGLRATVDELEEIGSGTGAALGKGVSGLSMTGMEAGHYGLSVTFEDFCERWEWGVRALVQDANAIAAKLGLSAGVLWEEERYIEGTLKIVVNAGVGNPNASEDDIVNQGWGDVLTPDYLSPDYSVESFERAGDEAKQTWKDTGRSLMTEGTGGLHSDVMNNLLGRDQETFDQDVDEVFGPSPEERARQQQQGNGGN